MCYDFVGEQPVLGVLSTPHWPRKYPPRLDCIRVISAPANYTVRLTFKGAVFEIEPPYGPQAKHAAGRIVFVKRLSQLGVRLQRVSPHTRSTRAIDVRPIMSRYVMVNTASRHCSRATVK
jgi:hypothetical protein